MDNPYDILELPRNSSKDDVKKKYRELALKYHPDKLGNINNEIEKNNKIEKFKKITVAYDIIINDKCIDDYEDDIFSPNMWKSTWETLFKDEETTKEILKDTFKDIAKIFFTHNIKPKSYYTPSTKCIKHNINLPVSYKEVYCSIKRKLRLILNKINEPIFLDINCNSYPKIIKNYIDDNDTDHEITINLLFDHDNEYKHEIIDDKVNILTDLELSLKEHILGVNKDFNYFNETININIEPLQDILVIKGKGINNGDLIINLLVKKLKISEWNKILKNDKVEMIRILNTL